MHWTITQGSGQVLVVIWEQAEEDCQTVVQALGHVGAEVGGALVGCREVVGRSVGLWVRNGVGGVGRGVGGGVGPFTWRLSANSCESCPCRD